MRGQSTPQARRAGADARPVGYPRIGIYTGKGASHSWLWFVEVFERYGFYDLSFPAEQDVTLKRLKGFDGLAVSGGDTFAIAEALGPHGAEALSAFIAEGGLYMGSCAGAYLPLHSSKEHLNHFNFVPAKITNLSRNLPEARRMKEKFCTCYGCSFIFHPVRETVEVTTTGRPSLGDVTTLMAPLYGGPPMTIADPDRVMATYSRFTDKTLFLVDRDLAAQTLLGNAAVIREEMGRGHLHLFGPHFEHPHFHEANRYLLNLMEKDLPWKADARPHVKPPSNGLTGPARKRFIRDLKRELSNSRIVAAGLEMLPLKWTIGNKVYEAGKIRVFLEALWRRMRSLENFEPLFVSRDRDEKLVDGALRITRALRAIKQGWDNHHDTLETATNLFMLLNKTSAQFLEIYFKSKLIHSIQEN